MDFWTRCVFASGYGNHGVKLAPEDLHRLSVRLNCNASFFGAYHDFEAQARGDAVRPALE
jgi:hypothetical protein